MSLQERTLVIKNFDPERTTHKLLRELCLQAGPVRNVVVKPDHAFIEYEDAESVGYSKALLDGVELFGKKLILEPKQRLATYFRYTQLLNDYIKYDRIQRQQQAAIQQQQQQQMIFLNQQAMPRHPQTTDIVAEATQFIPPPNQYPATIIANPNLDQQVYHLNNNENPCFVNPNFVNSNFVNPNFALQQLPPPSNSSRHPIDGLQRSQSFNQGNQPQRPKQFNRRSSDRGNDWHRRRR